MCLEEDTGGEQKKTKTHRGEEEGGNKYTKVIFLDHCGHVVTVAIEEERESERDEHKVLWVLSSKGE